jgi:hypothetical protein
MNSIKVANLISEQPISNPGGSKGNATQSTSYSIRTNSSGPNKTKQTLGLQSSSSPFATLGSASANNFRQRKESHQSQQNRGFDNNGRGNSPEPYSHQLPRD